MCGCGGFLSRCFRRVRLQSLMESGERKKEAGEEQGGQDLDFGLYVML